MVTLAQRLTQQPWLVCLHLQQSFIPSVIRKFRVFFYKFEMTTHPSISGLRALIPGKGVTVTENRPAQEGTNGRDLGLLPIAGDATCSCLGMSWCSRPSPPPSPLPPAVGQGVPGH